MSSPKLIIFGLDNTLIATRPAAKEGYRQAIYSLAKRHGIYNLRDKLYNHWKRLIQKLRQEKDPDKRRFTYSLQLLLDAHKIPDTFLPEALKTYEREMLSHLVATAGANDVLKALKEAGHMITVSTASDRGEAVKKMKQTDLYSYFDAVITANEVGVMKPDRRYITLCLDGFKGPPQNVLVVGDDKTEDLSPAETMGLRTFLVSPNLKHLSVITEEFSSWLAS